MSVSRLMPGNTTTAALICWTPLELDPSCPPLCRASTTSPGMTREVDSLSSKRALAQQLDLIGFDQIVGQKLVSRRSDGRCRLLAVGPGQLDIEHLPLPYRRDPA